MGLNFRIVVHVMGVLLLCNGIFMLFASGISAIYRESESIGIGLAATSTIILGIAFMYFTRVHRLEVKKRDGYLIVTGGWIFLTLTGLLPYMFTGTTATFTDAFFETISGYTTTGATIFDSIETLPQGILFWRSLTHWIGGMGIIVLAIAILPLLGIGGMQLFAAEAPGLGGDKLHPRITDTAKRLWLIYVVYTIAETLLLMAAGMTPFDAVNHAFSTMSTGGFSTRDSSVAFWNDQPLVQYIIMLFMFLAGTNFVVSYYMFTRQYDRARRDQEFRAYVSFITVFTLMVFLTLVFAQSVEWVPGESWGMHESRFRHALFQVLSVITTTGFVTADFTSWGPFLMVFFFGLMFIGGSSGSTSGGVKVIRHLLIIKNGMLEFKRSLHPRAVIPVRYNKRSVGDQISYNVTGFFVLYMLIFLIGSLGLGLMGLDFISAIGGAASSLGNVGPALGVLNPVSTYSVLADTAKWWCGGLMLLGRLELFTVLILFSPDFWKRF